MIYHRAASKIVMILVILGIIFCIGGFFTSWVIQDEESNLKIESQIFDAFEENNTVEVIVILEQSEERGIQSDILNDNPDFKVRYQYSAINGFSGEADKSTLEILADNPQVEKIYLNKKLEIQLDESVPLIKADKVQKTKLNNTNITGKYQSVCVIDTGVNYNHPALSGRVISGLDYINNDSDPMDDNEHGTHVAGIIASNDTTYRGVAPEAKIVAVKACNSGGGCDGDAVLAGIDWCISNSALYNVSVISMSLGDNGEYSESNCPTDYDSSINNAVANNIMVVVSSGNNDFNDGISFPSCSPNAISVGATTKNDVIWDDGNSGENLDLLAPGFEIYSTVLGTNWEYKTGTSMAAPHVSGVAALMYQEYQIRNQTITPEQIEDKLKSTGEGLTNPENNLDFPRVNAEEAILSARLEASYTASPYPIKNLNITLYGNYTNRTSNESISGGSCIIKVNGSTYNTTYDNGKYQHIHNFTTPAIYNYDVQCNQSNFESIITEGSVEVVNGSENCTYPGSNINWSLTGSAYSSCVVENLTINQSNIFIQDNSHFILNYTNLTLVGASVRYLINVSSTANFTLESSHIKGMDKTTRRLDIDLYGYGNLDNSTFENCQFRILGNNHVLTGNTFWYYSYFLGNSENNISETQFKDYSFFEDYSINKIDGCSFNRTYLGTLLQANDNPQIEITNSNFTGDTVYFLSKSVVNFSGKISNITNSIYVKDSPTIYGSVNMPDTATMLSNNTTRYYPVYVYYTGTTTPYPNKQVNITDSDGNLIWQGVTNSQGYVEPDLLLNTTNYGAGNFTISVNETQDINLLTDTPITLEAAGSSGNNGGGSSRGTTCKENWSCSEWDDFCVNDIQKRICTDLNNCGTKYTKPNETQACSLADFQSSRNGARLLTIQEIENAECDDCKDCCLFMICWFRYVICWYWWILIVIIVVSVTVSYWRMKRKKKKKIKSAMIEAVGVDWVIKKMHMK